LIPKNGQLAAVVGWPDARAAPPTLDSNFSKPFREFIALCLQRDPLLVRGVHPDGR